MDTCRANSGHGASDHMMAASWWWPHDGGHLLRLSKPQTPAAAAWLEHKLLLRDWEQPWSGSGQCRQTSVRKSEYCWCCLLCGECWDSECWITRLNVQLRAGNKLSCFCAHLTEGCLWDGDNITSLWDEFCLLPPRYDRHLLTPGNITSEDQGLFCLIINTAGEEGPGTEAVYHGFIAFQLALRCRGPQQRNYNALEITD